MNARAPSDFDPTPSMDEPAAASNHAAHPDPVPGLSVRALIGVLELAQRAQSATSLAALGFTMVNETLSLVAFRQAAFFRVAGSGHPLLQTASGLASVAADSPFAVWLNRFARTFAREPGCRRINIATIDASVVDGWNEWLPDHLVSAPLHAPDGDLLGFLLYAREDPWTDVDLALLEAIHRHYAYCLWSLGRRRLGLKDRSLAALRRRGLRWGLPLLLAILLIPVRLSALAPAEVVALHAVAVAAPQDGVVGRFHVAPNATVKTGDLLFSLDDTTLRSRREVAAKGLSIAQADLLVAQQRAFDELKSKGELAAATGRVREKEAELALIETSLARVDVRADRGGVAVFTDANDWIGRPVQTGERVMQLADPGDAGVLVWLPAADALNLEPGAPIRLFLHTHPLAPLSAHLLQTSYQAVPSPDGVAAYRLRGSFDGEPAEGDDAPRIGLRGTARVSGDWAVLGYYVFRRPIAALREWSGL
jgi:hypothetical protein